MTIRPTTYADLEALNAIFAHARAQMAADGNPSQWGDGYPSRQQLEEDIQRGVSYAVEVQGQVCATCLFLKLVDSFWFLFPKKVYTFLDWLTCFLN